MWAVIIGGFIIKAALRGTKAVLHMAKENKGQWEARNEAKQLEEKHGEAKFCDPMKVTVTKEELEALIDAKDPVRMYVIVGEGITRAEQLDALNKQFIEFEVVLTEQEQEIFREFKDPEELRKILNKGLQRAAAHKAVDAVLRKARAA